MYTHCVGIRVLLCGLSLKIVQSSRTTDICHHAHLLARISKWFCLPHAFKRCCAVIPSQWNCSIQDRSRFWWGVTSDCGLHQSVIPTCSALPQPQACPTAASRDHLPSAIRLCSASGQSGNPWSVTAFTPRWRLWFGFQAGCLIQQLLSGSRCTVLFCFLSLFSPKSIRHKHASVWRETVPTEAGSPHVLFLRWASSPLKSYLRGSDRLWFRPAPPARPFLSLIACFPGLICCLVC